MPGRCGVWGFLSWCEPAGTQKMGTSQRQEGLAEKGHVSERYCELEPRKEGERRAVAAGSRRSVSGHVTSGVWRRKRRQTSLGTTLSLDTGAEGCTQRLPKGGGDLDQAWNPCALTCQPAVSSSMGYSWSQPGVGRPWRAG